MYPTVLIITLLPFFRKTTFTVHRLYNDTYTHAALLHISCQMKQSFPPAIRPHSGTHQFLFILVLNPITSNFTDFQDLLNERCLRMALIHAHEHLGQIGERLGAASMLLKVERQQLLCATTGAIRAVLCRSGSAIQLPNRPFTITAEDYKHLRGGNATLSQVSFSLDRPALLPYFLLVRSVLLGAAIVKTYFDAVAVAVTLHE